MIINAQINLIKIILRVMRIIFLYLMEMENMEDILVKCFLEILMV